MIRHASVACPPLVPSSSLPSLANQSGLDGGMKNDSLKSLRQLTVPLTHKISTFPAHRIRVGRIAIRFALLASSSKTQAMLPFRPRGCDRFKPMFELQVKNAGQNSVEHELYFTYDSN